MLTAAVIAEFNPFHNGHRYLLDQARALGAERIVVIMSGNFTQRGEPAIYDKWTRTRAALHGGADLVIELPLPFAVAGAQRFARGGAAAAAAMGVDRLVFGSECGDVEQLRTAAEAVTDGRVEELLRRRMQDGVTFASARMQAVEELYGKGVAQLLREPNNALAVEYLLALRNTGITPCTIGRVGAAHDAECPSGKYASASFLRERIRSGSGIEGFVPDPEDYSGAPVCMPDALEAPLLSRLRAMDEEDFAALPDCSEGIERRLYAAARRARTLDELYALAKTKRYTLARIRRLALCAYLSVTEEMAAAPLPYVRPLGCTPEGRELLGRGTLPVNGSLARLARCGEDARRFARLEAAAGDQYALLQSPRGECGRDWTQGLLR